MKVLPATKKEIIWTNILLSSLISVLLTFGFIYPAWQEEQSLAVKLTHLQQKAEEPSNTGSTKTINLAELLKLLKANPAAEIRILSSTEEQGITHLRVSGTTSTLTYLINLLGASILQNAQLQRTPDGYELRLDLKEMRITPAQIVRVEAPLIDKVVGSVTYNEHHYCVVENAAHKIHLREQAQC
jgi:hypothetical protein